MPDVILLVAADLHFAKGIERACAAQGLESITADDGETALVALEFEKPLAVVLENDLRDTPGLQLAKEMRSRPEGEAIPIVLLAGAMMPAAEIAGSAAKNGVTATIDATVDVNHLAIGLRALLEGDTAPMEKLVNGEAIDEGTSTSEAEATQPDPPSTAVSEDDEPPPAKKPKKKGSDEIEVEVDDSVITGGRIKAPPEPKKPKYPPAAPRSGSLTTIAFARLLAELFHDHATGVLELHREKVKKSIWLQDGVPQSAKSNAMGETLGAVLVKMGKITEDQRNASVEKMQKEKRKHGDVLVEMGIVKQKDIASALQAQARAKVINCFAWDDGSYDFKPLGEIPREHSELRMSFGALIASGVKQRYDLPRLRKVLLPHISETPRLEEAMTSLIEDIKYEDSERAVIESLKGRRSLAEVLALSDMDELQLHRVLVTAFFSGAVQFHPEGLATRQYRMEKEGLGEVPESQPVKQLTSIGASAQEKTPVPEKTRQKTAVPEKTKTSAEDEDEFNPFHDDEDSGERTNLADSEPPPPPKKAPAKPDPSRDPTGGRISSPPSASDEETRPPDVNPEVEAKVNAALTRMRSQNHYERLGVATESTGAQIKAAYLRLAKEYHPDRLIQDGGSGIKTKADELFSMVADAYQTLTDDAKRKKYDDEVLRGIKDDATDEANAILNAEHQFLKGERLLKAGNIQKAFEAFAAAIELYPKESEYQACYGWTMFKLNHPANTAKCNEGEKILKNALSMNARNDKAHLFLGQIAKIKGDLDGARKQFEKALEIQPDNIEAQRELRVMDMRDSKKSGIGGLFRGGKK